MERARAANGLRPGGHASTAPLATGGIPRGARVVTGAGRQVVSLGVEAGGVKIMRSWSAAVDRDASIRHRVLALRADRGSSHWLQLDAPDRVNRLLLDVLGSVPADAATAAAQQAG